MNTEKISSEFNVDLDIVNALHLAAFNLCDRDAWLEFTDGQQEAVISLLVAKYQFERMRHKIMEFSEPQQCKVAELLAALDERATD